MPSPSCWPAAASPSASRSCSASWWPTAASSARFAKTSAPSEDLPTWSSSRGPPARFSARLADRIASLPGVARSASLLRETAVVIGPRGSQRVQFVGIDPNLISLGGFATKNLGAGALLLARGVGLPSSLASAIGTEARQSVTLVVNGSSSRVRVRAVLNSGTIGPLASVPLVAALLPYAQTIAGSARTGQSGSDRAQARQRETGRRRAACARRQHASTSGPPTTNCGWRKRRRRP